MSKVFVDRELLEGLARDLDISACSMSEEEEKLLAILAAERTRADVAVADANDAERALATVTAERDGENERAKMLLSAKNDWADRARTAELERDQLRAEVEALRPHITDLLEFIFDRFGSVQHAAELTDQAVAAVRALEPFAAMAEKEA